MEISPRSLGEGPGVRAALSCSQALPGNTLPGCSASAKTADRLLVSELSIFQFKRSRPSSPFQLQQKQQR